MKNIYASLDIGSSTIKLIVGELINSNINVLFAKMNPAHGIRHGKIVDEAVVSQDIMTIINEANKALHTEITSVLLNIPTNNASLYQSEGTVAIHTNNHLISSDDVIEALSQSKRFEKEEDEAFVSVVPVRYYYGNVVTQELPIGKPSQLLKVDSLIIATKKQLLYSYVRCVERAGLSVIDISVDAFSCAKEAFDKVYLEEGAILIDIGNKSTKISFFESGFLQFLTTIPVGGHTLTKRLAKAWRISMEKAETYKIKYGTCSTLLSGEDIIHTTTIDNQVTNYTQKDLSAVLIEGVEEIMNLAKVQLMAINSGRSYEVVIVGGGGELEKIDDIASRIIEAPIRVYRPQTIGARNMAYTANLGLIYYLSDRKDIIGEQKPSLVLTDISNTMSLRLKGLTKTSSNKQHENKFAKVLDVLFSDED